MLTPALTYLLGRLNWWAPQPLARLHSHHVARRPLTIFAKVRHLARHQITGLTGAFLLGMAVNLTGLPSRTSGGAHIASIAFLAAHVNRGRGEEGLFP